MTQDLRCVAFDFDGVIADSMGVQEEIWRSVARSVIGDPRVEQQLVRNLYRGNAKEQMFENVSVTTSQARELRKAKDALWFDLRDATPLIQGAAAYLPVIKRKYLTAIVTTADRHYVEAILARENLSGAIDTALTDDDVAIGKPAPDLVFEACRRFSVTTDEVCVVGDSDSDIEMSKRAGCKFILFAPDRRE